MELDDSCNIGYVSDPLARILAPILDGGVITHMEGTVTVVTRSALEGICVPGGGIEIPCEYVLYGLIKRTVTKLDKCSEHAEVKEAKVRRLKLPCVTVYSLVIV